MTLYLHVAAHTDVCRHFSDLNLAELRVALREYAHAWLRSCMGLPADADLQLGYNAHGKPYLRNHPEWQFNLSHSKRHLAIICGQTPHALGIDIESYPRTIRPAVIEASLSAKEYTHYLMAAEPLRYWLQVWTLKEALLKAAGVGIQQDLRLLDTGFDGNERHGSIVWQQQAYAHQSLTHEHYQCAIAWQNEHALPLLQSQALHP